MFALTEISYQALFETLISIVIEFISIQKSIMLTILVVEFVYNGISRGFKTTTVI